MISTSFVEKLGTELSPLMELVSRRVDQTLASETAVRISHRPAIGSEAFEVTLFAPIDRADRVRYEENMGVSISHHYASILDSINGAHIFDLCLYGIPRSMLGNPALLDRSIDQPLDLATANRYWSHEFNASPELFHFGSGRLADDENVGYFFDSSGAVLALRKSGAVWREWPNFEEFFAAELDRAETEYPESEARFIEVRLESRRPFKSKFFRFLAWFGR